MMDEFRGLNDSLFSSLKRRQGKKEKERKKELFHRERQFSDDMKDGA